MRGRCGSSPWTPETAPGERPCRMLREVRCPCAQLSSAHGGSQRRRASCTTMDPTILSTVPALPALSQSAHRDRRTGASDTLHRKDDPHGSRPPSRVLVRSLKVRVQP